MRLYEEIFKNVDGVAVARCVFVPCGGGYFEGVKSVADFSEEKLTLHFPHQQIEVEGEALCIKKYSDGDLRLSGKILSIRVVLPAEKDGEASARSIKK